MKDESKKTQVGIIVVAHADYGSAMLRTAEFILGPQSDCSSISVDVGQEVSETVRRLNDAAQRLDKGAGVIIICSEMEEAMGMSDRILVMHEGRITAEFSRDDATQEKIMYAASNLERSKPETPVA